MYKLTSRVTEQKKLSLYKLTLLKNGTSALLRLINKCFKGWTNEMILGKEGARRSRQEPNRIYRDKR